MKKVPFEREVDAARIESALLGSFDDDVPPRGAKLAAMAALGAGIAHAGIVSAAIDSVPSAGVGARLGAVTASKATALVVAKWFGVGILGGTAVFGPLEIANRRQASLQKSDTTVVAATTAAGRSERPTLSPREIDVGPERPAEPPAAMAPVAPAREPSAQGEPLARGRVSAPPEPPQALPMTEARGSAPTASATAERPAPLAAEIGWLDGVRRALAAGQPGLAVTLLDRYDRDFASGTLRPEAIVLRVEALVKAGDRAGAAAVAQRSVATLPERYREKIRVLLSP